MFADGEAQGGDVFAGKVPDTAGILIYSPNQNVQEILVDSASRRNQGIVGEVADV